MEAVFSFKSSFWERSTEKTEAASVLASAEPVKKQSQNSRRSSR